MGCCSFAALLWRVHLIFWPFYLVFALYAGARLVSHDTRAGWRRAVIAFLLLGAVLAPVGVDALRLYREATAHVIVPAPSAREPIYAVKLIPVILCAAGAWLLSGVFGWRREKIARPSWTAFALIFGAWLCQPLRLFAVSRITGNSVFVLMRQNSILTVACPKALR